MATISATEAASDTPWPASTIACSRGQATHSATAGQQQGPFTAEDREHSGWIQHDVAPIIGEGSPPRRNRDRNARRRASGREARQGKHRTTAAGGSSTMTSEHSLSDALEGRVGCDRAPDISRCQEPEVLPEVMFRGEILGAAHAALFFSANVPRCRAGRTALSPSPARRGAGDGCARSGGCRRARCGAVRPRPHGHRRRRGLRAHPRATGRVPAWTLRGW